MSEFSPLLLPSRTSPHEAAFELGLAMLPMVEPGLAAVDRLARHQTGTGKSLLAVMNCMLCAQAKLKLAPSTKVTCWGHAHLDTAVVEFGDFYHNAIGVKGLMIGQRVWDAVTANSADAQKRYEQLASLYVNLVELPDGISDPDTAFGIQDQIEDGEKAGVQLRELAASGGFIDRKDGTLLIESRPFVSKFNTRLSDQLDNQFWSTWYSDLFIGAPIDADVLAALVKLDWSHWDKGPNYMSLKIDRILDRDRDWRERGEVVLRQAERLLASQHASLMLLDTTAAEIDTALNELMSAGTLNATPEVFATLQHVPKMMREIASCIRTEGKHDQLEALLEQFIVQVSQVASELGKPKRTFDFEKIKETAVTTSVKIGTTAFWTGFIATTSHVTGVVDITEVLNTLSSGAQSVVVEGSPTLETTKVRTSGVDVAP